MIPPVSRARRIYNYFQQHWMLSALVQTAPGYVFVMIQVAGPELRLIDAENQLTPLAMWIFWPVFAMSVAFSLVKARADSVDEVAKEKGQFILHRMIESVDRIKARKLRRFCKYIAENAGGERRNPFHDITQPERQIESILENIQMTLADIFGMDVNQIGLSIVYKLDQEDPWQRLSNVNVEGDISLDELVGNSQTSARQIIDGKRVKLFYPDKRIGEAEKCYVMGNLDKSYDGIGSVLCHDASLDLGDGRMRAVLSITSYGCQLCAQNDQSAHLKIREVLLPPFEVRLRLELALLYIKRRIAEPSVGGG